MTQDYLCAEHVLRVSAGTQTWRVGLWEACGMVLQGRRIMELIRCKSSTAVLLLGCEHGLIFRGSHHSSEPFPSFYSWRRISPPSSSPGNVEQASAPTLQRFPVSWCSTNGPRPGKEEMCWERQYDKQCCYLKTERKVNSLNQKIFSLWLATLRRAQGFCTLEMVAKPAMEMRNPSIRVKKVILNSFASSEFFHLAWIWGEHLGNFDLISQAITSKWEFSLLEESADFLGEVKSCPPSLTLWNEHPWLLVLCSQASRSTPVRRLPEWRQDSKFPSAYSGSP